MICRHHKQKHGRSSLEQSNVCSECGREFVNGLRMRAHFQNVHAKVRCKLCGEVCAGTLGSQKHNREEHSPSVMCDVCG